VLIAIILFLLSRMQAQGMEMELGQMLLLEEQLGIQQELEEENVCDGIQCLNLSKLSRRIYHLSVQKREYIEKKLLELEYNEYSLITNEMNQLQNDKLNLLLIQQSYESLKDCKINKQKKDNSHQLSFSSSIIK